MLNTGALKNCIKETSIVPKLLKKICFSFAIFIAFSASGHLAMYLEAYHNSIIASSAVFGVSFASLIGSGLNIWNDIIS
jgi:hypothetical protein